jgi:hypothetical protein
MNFHGYELACVRSRGDSSRIHSWDRRRSRQWEILHRGSSYGIQKEFNVWAVTVNCNFKEVPINPVIKSRTHYYSSRQPRTRDSINDDQTQAPISLRGLEDLPNPTLNERNIHFVTRAKYLRVNLKHYVENASSNKGIQCDEMLTLNPFYFSNALRTPRLGIWGRHPVP